MAGCEEIRRFLLLVGLACLSVAVRGSACVLTAVEINASREDTVRVVAGLPYVIDAFIAVGDEYGTGCCSAVRWGLCGLDALPCVSMAALCPPGSGSFGTVWRSWQIAPDIPGEHTVTVAIYGDVDCSGDPYGVVTRTLHVVRGETSIWVDVAEPYVDEEEEILLTATVSSLVGDPSDAFEARWEYEVGDPSVAVQIVGTVVFYAEGVHLGSLPVYGAMGNWGHGAVGLGAVLAVGTHEITAHFISSKSCHDDAVSDVTTVTVRDTTPPTDPALASSSHAVNTWSPNERVSIQADGAADTGSGVDGFEVAWTQDGEWTPMGEKTHEETWEGETFTATTDGEWFVHVATVDGAGNWSEGVSLGPFCIDSTPPSVPAVLLPVDGMVTNCVAVALAWEAATDSGGSGLRDSDTYYVRVLGTPERSYYTAGTTYTPTLAEGTFVWRVRARDNAGNNSDYSVDRTFTIDTTPPTSPHLLAPHHTVGVRSNNPHVVIEATGANDPESNGVASGVAGFEVEWSQHATWSPTQVANRAEAWAGDAFEAVTDGEWYVHVATVDRAGNWTQTERLGPFWIDVTIPLVMSVTVDSELLCETDRTQRVTVAFNEAMDHEVQPAIAFCQGGFVSQGDGAWSADDTVWTETFDQDGAALEESSITVRVSGARDAAGNVQETYLSDPLFAIDTVKPEIVSVTSTTADGAYRAGDIHVTVEFSEPVILSGGPLMLTLNTDPKRTVSIDPFGLSDRVAATYTIVAGDNACLLDVTAVALADGAVLRDEAGNDAVITVPAITLAEGSSLAVDTAGPTTSGLSLPGGVIVVDPDECAVTVGFTATVIDNCSLRADHVIVVVELLPGSDAACRLSSSFVATNETEQQVHVTGSFTVWELSDSPVQVRVSIHATDCSGNQATAVSSVATVVDEESPVISWDEPLPTSPQYVSSDTCEISFPVEATVWDACCIDVANVTIDVSVSNATLVHTVAATQIDPTTVLVAGEITVSALTGCPAVLSIEIHATDGSGNVAPTLRGSVEVYDTTRPLICDLQFNADATYSAEQTVPYLVDECGLVIVYFSAHVTDNCSVHPGDVGVTVTLPSQNAILEEIVVHRTATSQDRVDVRGHATVRCLDGPAMARVQVDVAAVDGCGNEAVPVSTGEAEGLVHDIILPIPRDDPRQDRPMDERAIIDPLVTIGRDELGRYRLIVRENTPVRIDVLANDADNLTHNANHPFGPCVACGPCAGQTGCCAVLYLHEIVDPPQHGTATIEVDEGDCHGGTVILYAPDQGYLGPDSFTYRIRDAFGNVSDEIATVYLAIGLDQAPIAGPDTAIARQGAPVYLDVLANDFAPCGVSREGLTLVSLTPPWLGHAVIMGSIVRYVPFAGMTGEDTFTYTVRHLSGATAQGEVTVHVVEILQPSSATLSVCPGESVEVIFSVQDPWVLPDLSQGIELSASWIAGPLHGVLIGDVGQVVYSRSEDDPCGQASIQFTYVAAVGMSGWDSVAIRFEDPFGNQATARAEIHVHDCFTEAASTQPVVVEQGRVVTLHLPSTYVESADTDWDSVLRCASTGAWGPDGALVLDQCDTLGGSMLRLATGGLPPGEYLIEFDLSEGVVMLIPIRVAPMA